MLKSLYVSYMWSPCVNSAAKEVPFDCWLTPVAVCVDFRLSSEQETSVQPTQDVTMWHPKHITEGRFSLLSQSLHFLKSKKLRHYDFLSVVTAFCLCRAA